MTPANNNACQSLLVDRQVGMTSNHAIWRHRSDRFHGVHNETVFLRMPATTSAHSNPLIKAIYRATSPQTHLGHWRDLQEGGVQCHQGLGSWNQRVSG